MEHDGIDVHLDWTVDQHLRRVLNSGESVTPSPASAQGLVILLDEYDRRGREIARLRDSRR